MAEIVETVDQVARDRASAAITRLDVTEARDEEKWKNATASITDLNATVKDLGNTFNRTLIALSGTLILLLLGVIGTLLTWLFRK